MKLKRILAVLTALAMVLACSACSGKTETAAEVVEKMKAALDETSPTQYEINLDMDAVLSLGDYGSMDFGITSLVNCTQSANPYASHTVMDTEISYGEGIEPTASTIETYSVLENDEVVAYATSDGGSTWTRSESGLKEADVTDGSDLVSFDAEDAAIDSSVTEYNGEKVVCLTATFTGEELQQTLAAASEEFASVVEGLDLSPLSCAVKVYVNAATYLPIAEELDISGAGDVLTTLLASILGDGITVEVSACTLSVNYSSYEAQDAVTVPQEVLDNATELATAITDALGTEEEEELTEGLEAVEEVAEESAETESAAQ